VQRWQREEVGEDRRQGPKTPPHNRLSTDEQTATLAVMTSPEYRDLSPKQIVPQLADPGCYMASESTMYRLLPKEKLLAHRGRQQPRTAKAPSEHVAAGPNQVWSWDITYLRSPTRGLFYYLYLLVDVWSRKIVGPRVHNEKSSDLASVLMVDAIASEVADPTQQVLHQDNGGPMKGATLKATLETLGVIASYSRPRVSDDNPFSEALFRTLKYRPEYPTAAFSSPEQSAEGVESFVDWYNTRHLHSAVGFVSPTQRHEGRDSAILAQRRVVYEAARRRNPRRWYRETRNWSAPATVILNPTKQTKISQTPAAHAA